MKKICMEFLGTFFFILTIIVTKTAFAIAPMLMAWIYIGERISGAHYNPLISYAMVLKHQLQWRDFFWYFFAQLLGSCAAVACAYYLNVSIALPHPAPEITLLQAFVVETLISFVFALTVLTVASFGHYRGSYIFGLVIGGVVPALVYFGGPLSGGLFNPALALGTNIIGLFMHMSISVHNLVMYIGGAFLGAFLAVTAYDFFHEDDRVY